MIARFSCRPVASQRGSRLSRCSFVGVLLAISAQIAPAQDYSFSILAGTANAAGNTDGPAASARFDRPWGIAVDRDGTVYVADQYNCTIRQIRPGGTVTTFAGRAGAVGSADGPGDAARFNLPSAVALDAAGNLFVADTNNALIRKITPAGVVTTVAGNPAGGSADGTATAARFLSPNGIAVDASGTLFVGDTGNHTIRKITTAGVVTTFAGAAGRPGYVDGSSSAARFNYPSGIAVDANGNLFVADQLNHVIRKITADGTVSTLAGSTTAVGDADGTGSAAQFRSPIGLAVDGNGSLFVGDMIMDNLRKITAAGVVTTVMTGVTGFNGSRGIAVDAAGNLFFTSANSNTVRKGALVASPAAVGQTRLANLSVLSSIAVGETMTLGVVIGGADTVGTKPILTRAAGPSLAAFGVASTLPDPQMALIASTGGATVATNNDWGGDATLAGAFARVGAFGYAAATSKDSALFQPALAPGNYTVQVSDAGGGSGSVIAELYDASPADAFAATTPRLINVSVLKRIAAGTALSAGFVIAGAGTKTVLLRAVGPSLGAAPFNISGAMADPKLELYNNSTGLKIAENNDWGTPVGSSGGTVAQLSAAFAATGAFALASASTKDAVLLATLTPDQYSVRVTASDGASGIAIVEVYEVPSP